MIRGTTAQFKFNLPYQLKDITYAEVIFWQKGDSFSSEHSVEIIKKFTTCPGDQSGTEFKVTLNHEETLRFTDKKPGYVQFRAVSAYGNSVFASKQESFIVYPFFNDSQIGDFDPPEDDDLNGWIIIDSGRVGG